MKDDLQLLEELGLGSRLNRLSQYMMKNIHAVYQDFDIDFDPFLFPIFKMLITYSGTTTTRIQEGLQYTQPAITQGLKKLENKHLVTYKTDTHDKRKKKFYLTQKGEALHMKMIPIWKSMDVCVKRLTHFPSDSLHQHIVHLEALFKEKSLRDRILEQHQTTD